MSEEYRSRLYGWLCEQTDEQLAEYLMSCLPPTPTADLVTKEYLSAELSKYATKADLDAKFDRLFDLRDTDLKAHARERDADRKERARERDADREERVGQRDADRKEHALERDADRRDVADLRTEVAHLRTHMETQMVTKRQHRWVVAIGVAIAVEILLANLGFIPSVA